MIKVYMHYGIEVRRQVIDQDFRQVLRDKGIRYIDLPIMDTDVIKYVNDGVTRYAVIKDLIAPEEFWQAVYITEQIPDDLDWDRLIEDVEAQEQGDDPAKMTSKLKMILDAAEQAARDNKMSAGDMDVVFNGVDIEDIGWSLIQMKYGKSKIEGMGQPDDVDADFLRSILDWME